MLVWIIVFVVSMALLIKGCDWFLVSAEKLGLAAGLSPFIVGTVIVGAGTSLPELISSFAAMARGATDIVVANAVGSNIANILLVIGLAVLVGRRLVISKSLIDLDLPLLAIASVIFLGSAWDKNISQIESLLMVGVYIVYLVYSVKHEESDEHEIYHILPLRQEQREHTLTSAKHHEDIARPLVGVKDYGLLVGGLASLIIGAKYLIESVIAISGILAISAGAIAITAVAVGTSLPEIIVSVKAARQKKSEIALGNIFGSNVFNMFVVVGFPGLFKNLAIDDQTFSIGLPTLGIVTMLFVISGISRRIHMWEGIFYLALYVLFVGKLYTLF